jgi:hypothetical protein
MKKTNQKNQTNKKPNKKGPGAEEYHPPQRPTFKRPESMPTRRPQVNRPQIRRPQHYG